MPLNFESFIHLLLLEKGLEKLEPEVLEEIRKDMERRIEDFVNAKIVASLSPKKLAEFEELLDRGASQEEFRTFLDQELGDFDSFLASALLEFRQAYLGY